MLPPCCVSWGGVVSQKRRNAALGPSRNAETQKRSCSPPSRNAETRNASLTAIGRNARNAGNAGQKTLKTHEKTNEKTAVTPVRKHTNTNLDAHIDTK
jgi:hypothetical protein